MTSTVDPTAIFYGVIGAASALSFASAGAAYGTYESCRGIAKAYTSPVRQPESGDMETPMGDYASLSEAPPAVNMKSLIPIVIAGVLAIYGLIYAVIVMSSVTASDYNLARGYAQFGGGLAVGLSCLVAGIAVGVCGRAGAIATARNPKLFVMMTLNLVYCEAIGLYGLIIGLIAANTFL